MLFNAVVQSTTSEMFTISGNSWSNCLSYLEGTGKTIKTITLQYITIREQTSRLISRVPPL